MRIFLLMSFFLLLPIKVCAESEAVYSEVLFENLDFRYSQTSILVNNSSLKALLLSGNSTDLRDFEGFSRYYLDIMPFHQTDFLLEAASKTIFSVDVAPLVSISDVDLFTHVNSPVNYFLYLAKLGKAIQSTSLKNAAFDPVSINMNEYAKVEEMQLFDGKGFIPIPLTNNLSVDSGFFESIFSEAVWRLSLEQAGYELPVIFSGFVDPEVANDIVSDTLFLDDTVFGLSWGHGKFTHLIQLGMLFHDGIVDKNRMALIVQQREWPHILDRSMDKWSSLSMSVSGHLKKQKFHHLPELSSPTRLQENLIRNFFSRLIMQASQHEENACQYLKLYFKNEIDVPTQCQKQLNDYANYIRIVENWVVMDFVDDINILWRQAEKRSEFKQIIREWLLEVIENEKLPMSVMELDAEINCENLISCEARFMVLVSKLACIASFHANVVGPFMKIREHYYKGKKYPILYKGEGYRVYSVEPAAE